MLLLILYSCLIARNLLSGLKTCAEVSSYMFDDGETLLSGPMLTNSCLEDSGKADRDYIVCTFPFIFLHAYLILAGALQLKRSIEE